MGIGNIGDSITLRRGASVTRNMDRPVCSMSMMSLILKSPFSLDRG